MAATPDPRLLAILEPLVANSPGTVLKPPRRYALTMIAQQKAETIGGEDFAKAAGQGVSPEAHAAERAADQMAAAAGLAPPPLPEPSPEQAGAAAFQQASGQGQGQVQPQAQAGAAATANAQPGPSNPPPNTYYDPTRGISVYDPNYHGPYTAIPSMPGQTGQTPPAAPTGGAAVAPASDTLGPRPGEPVHRYATHQFADVDQGRIDHAWQMFDAAMARVPKPAPAAKIRDIGLAELFTMAAAGAVDPVAGAHVAAALFNAPVLAAEAANAQADKDYGNSVRLWQTETQRAQNAATQTERSELAGATRMQHAYDTEYERTQRSYDTEYEQQLKTVSEWDRRATSIGNKQLTVVSGMAKNLQNILTSKPLDADTRAQFTDQLNALNDFMYSGLPALDADGKPTPQFEKLQKDMAVASKRADALAQQARYTAARTGLTEDQAFRLRALLPHEIRKMDAQAENLDASTLATVWRARESAARIDDLAFRQNLAVDQFQRSEVTAQLAATDKMLAANRKEAEDLAKKAAKADKAVADASVYQKKDGTWTNAAKKAEYEQAQKDAADARADLETLTGPNGQLTTLTGISNNLRAMLSPTQNPGPQTTVGGSGQYGSVAPARPSAATGKGTLIGPQYWKPDSVQLKGPAASDAGVVNAPLRGEVGAVADYLGYTIEAQYAKTGHSTNVKPYLTPSGRSDVRSRHADGFALDIQKINGVHVGPTGQGRELADRFVRALESLGYARNSEPGHPRAVLWMMRGHEDHIHVSNMLAEDAYGAPGVDVSAAAAGRPSRGKAAANGEIPNFGFGQTTVGGRPVAGGR